MRLQLTAIILATTVMGCQDREPLAAPLPPDEQTPAPMQRVVYLVVSDLAPQVGATIVVAGNVGIGDSLSIASFRVRLGYDSKALHYVDEVALPGMMRVVNPQTDEIIVAGASGDGSGDGRLFAVRFRVDDVKGLESLGLSIDEMNDRGYASQLPSLTHLSRLQLDRKLVAGRGTPR